MDEPVIVCLSHDRGTRRSLGEVLRRRSARDDSVLLLASRDELARKLPALRREGRYIALVVVVRRAGEPLRGERVREILRQTPPPMWLLLTDDDPVAARRDLDEPEALHRLPWEEGALLRQVDELVQRFELARHRRALEEGMQHLELLSTAGVTMAGSFDIREILRETHRVASELAEGRPVDVFYAGRRTIHSRPLWFPESPRPGNLSSAQREEIRARAERLVESEPTELAPLSADSLGSLELAGERACFPIAYQNDLLGYLLVSREADRKTAKPGLVSILTLQAATALRNIHLTQERIHFERLSAIGRMIGSVVHDFRSPLTALKGYAGMLTRLELGEAERRAYASCLLEECDRLDHMVGELLELTRGGRSELELRWLPLRKFLDRFAGRVRTHFADRGLRVELRQDFDGEICVDPERMHRALWNVATNACQAMSRGGCLRIATRRRGNTVVVELRDDGCGIPAEIRHRIFEPFFSYGKTEGIGLGMAIARRIVEEHGGEIRVESEPGEGTSVRFSLPMEAREDAAAMAAASTKANSLS